MTNTEINLCWVIAILYVICGIFVAKEGSRKWSGCSGTGMDATETFCVFLIWPIFMVNALMEK